MESKLSLCLEEIQRIRTPSQRLQKVWNHEVRLLVGDITYLVYFVSLFVGRYSKLVYRISGVRIHFEKNTCKKWGRKSNKNAGKSNLLKQWTLRRIRQIRIFLVPELASISNENQKPLFFHPMKFPANNDITPGGGYSLYLEHGDMRTIWVGFFSEQNM